MPHPSPDPTIAARLCARLDLTAPSLASALQQVDTTDPVQTALAVIRALRQRQTPRFPYTREWVHQLRQRLSTEEIAVARERWAEALTSTDLFYPYHSNSIAALGANVIQAGATPELCARTEAWISGMRDQWALPTFSFGATSGCVSVITYLWPLDECPDSCFIYLLEWLFSQATGEWSRSRSWGDNMLGPSGHNWYAHAYSGIFLAGLYFPEIKGAARWRSLGAPYLERELFLLFEDDGWSKEGVSGYHRFAMTALFHFLHACDLNHIPISQAARERFRLCAQAGWRLIMPDGMAPVFHDDGHHSAFPGFGSLQNTTGSLLGWTRFCAGYFQLPEAKQAVEHFEADYAGYITHEGIDVTAAYQALTPVELPCDTVLPKSGYYVMRSGWGPGHDALAISAGVVGPIVASHKHVDLFNFELYIGGERMIVDNWYGDCKESAIDPMVRRWRVGSSSHNVATVDGEDHAEVQRIYRYDHLMPSMDAWETTDRYAYFSAAHEGYRRLGPEREVSVVRRKLFYVRGGYWILLDRFCPLNDVVHTYQQHFHLKPKAQLQADGRVIMQGETAGLMIVPIPSLQGQATIRENPYPVEGYENPQHLCYEMNASGPRIMAVLLVPLRHPAIPAVTVETRPIHCDERILHPHEATAIAIDIDGHRDLYVNFHSHWTLPWTVDDHAGQSRVYHSQCHD